jgi:hypothetical protein
VKAGETRAGAARAAAVAIASLSREVLARRFISLRQRDRFRGLLGFEAPTLLSAFRFPTHEWISTERAARLAAKSPAEIRCEKNLSEIFFPYAHLV